MEEKFYFAQKAFIRNANKILLIQKSESDPNQANKWEVPGGRMKFGEEVDKHLIREVFEEVGLDIIPKEPFFIWQWQLVRKNSENRDLKIQIVAVARLCELKGGEISFKGHEEDDYISNYKWVDLKEIRNFDLIENMYPVVDKFIEVYGK